MFSLILFGIVAFILLVGFIVVTIRRKNKRGIRRDSDESAIDIGRSGITHPAQRSKSAFNETPTSDIKGGILPADSKLPQNDFSDEDQITK